MPSAITKAPPLDRDGTRSVPTGAPVKAVELSGASPDRGARYRSVVDGNCVFNRKGGEQPKTNEQSVTVL